MGGGKGEKRNAKGGAEDCEISERGRASVVGETRLRCSRPIRRRHPENTVIVRPRRARKSGGMHKNGAVDPGTRFCL